MLIEQESDGSPDSWLSVERTKPAESQEASEDAEASSQGPGFALALRFSWDSGLAEACWTETDASPRLEIDSLNSRLFTLEPLAPGANG